MATAHPVKSRSKRAERAIQIRELQSQNRASIYQQQRMIREGEGSAVADAFNKLGTVGLDRFKLSMLAAILMDFIPFTVSMALSFCVGAPCKKVRQNSTQYQSSRVAVPDSRGAKQIVPVPSAVVTPQKVKHYRNKYDEDYQQKLARIRADIESDAIDRLTMKIGRELYQLPDTRTRLAQVDLYRDGLLFRNGKRYRVAFAA